jgi:hypothetical protein
MGGDGNRWDSVAHQSMNTLWHYIYFGYSRQLRRAYWTAVFRGFTIQKDFPAVNHYLTERFFF